MAATDNMSDDQFNEKPQHGMASGLARGYLALNGMSPEVNNTLPSSHPFRKLARKLTGRAEPGPKWTAESYGKENNS
jgi:hypothetical protein